MLSCCIALIANETIVWFECVCSTCMWFECVGCLIAITRVLYFAVVVCCCGIAFFVATIFVVVVIHISLDCTVTTLRGLCLCSLPVGIALFKWEQREKIRKRLHLRAMQLETARKKIKQAPKVPVRVEAPKVGGAKPAVPQDYIDLSLGADSGEDQDDAGPAAATPPAMAAGDAGVVPPAAAQRSFVRESADYTRRPMQYPPRGHHLNPVVPATIESLWAEVELLYDRKRMDAPLCPAGDCPFCSTKIPLMRQRHSLMQRLVVLEKLIWLGGAV